MPRPGIGNPNNRGGRRKSAYQEMADAQALNEMFFRENDIKNLKDKIERGFYSVQDIALLKALEGDVRVIAPIFNKIFPDNLNKLNDQYQRSGSYVLSDEDEKRVFELFRNHGVYKDKATKQNDKPP
ncbi:hypothetical protein HY450_03000 [Candidatus Pacearchaeota archaeon]|nr:hypothetical protein [Candidatus Pacearchaeota archaeon]